jgi:hypothetical protein
MADLTPNELRLLRELDFYGGVFLRKRTDEADSVSFTRSEFRLAERKNLLDLVHRDGLAEAKALQFITRKLFLFYAFAGKARQVRLAWTGSYRAGVRYLDGDVTAAPKCLVADS